MDKKQAKPPSRRAQRVQRARERALRAEKKRIERMEFLASMNISRTQVNVQTAVMGFGFALLITGGITAVILPSRPELFYHHHFIPDLVGFKNPAEVLLVNTPQRRLMVQQAIEKKYVLNEFNLNLITDEGLYLRQNNLGRLELLTSVRQKKINKMALVPMREPITHTMALYERDAIAYYGPRALQTITHQHMLDSLRLSRKMLYRDLLELGGCISKNSDGSFAPYTVDDLPKYFSRFMPIKEGRLYLNAQIDINNPNAKTLLTEYLGSSEHRRNRAEEESLSGEKIAG